MRRLPARRCSTARTSCSRSRARSRSPTSSRPRRATVRGPYDVSLVEGSITTAARRRAHPRRCGAQSRQLVTIGACATAGGIQALRNFADVDELPVAPSTRRPSTSRRSRTSTPISAHVPVDFELHGCPIDKHQLIEVLSRIPARAPARRSRRTSVCIECKRRGTVCVMVAHGTPCLGPVTHAGLRRDLPVVRPRLLRLLRPDGVAEPGVAHPQPARARHATTQTSSASTRRSTCARSTRCAAMA